MDKVVCISDCTAQKWVIPNNYSVSEDINGVNCFMGIIYYSTDVYDYIKYISKYISIYNDTFNYIGFFNKDNFILLSEYRESKIKDILNG